MGQGQNYPSCPQTLRVSGGQGVGADEEIEREAIETEGAA